MNHQVVFDGDIGDYRWVFDHSSVDWEELSQLYRIAPLGEKPPADLAVVFPNSMFTCFVFDGSVLVGAGRALADGLDCAYIADVAVHPRRQGRGLGKAIITSLISMSKGHKKIILYANPGTEGFYAKLGFHRMNTAMAIWRDPAKAIAAGLISETFIEVLPEIRPPGLGPGPTAAGSNLATYALLLTVVLTLGFNWPLMSIGLQSISPLWLITFRMGGALILIMGSVALAAGQLHLPRRSDLPVVWSVGVIRLLVVSLVVFYALEIVPPGRSSVLAWTASLWTVPLAAIFLSEKMTRLRWLGLTIGVAGIVLLFEPWRFDWNDGRVIGGHVLLMVSAVTSAATTVHIRKHGWTSSTLEIMPWQLLAASLPVAIVALVLEGIPTIDWNPQLVGIVIYEGLFATSLAVWAQQTVLQRLPAVSTNLTLMAVPVVGLLSSVVLVGEQLTVPVVGALLLILAGVAANILADQTGS